MKPLLSHIAGSGLKSALQGLIITRSAGRCPSRLPSWLHRARQDHFDCRRYLSCLLLVRGYSTGTDASVQVTDSVDPRAEVILKYWCEHEASQSSLPVWNVMMICCVADTIMYTVNYRHFIVWEKTCAYPGRSKLPSVTQAGNRLQNPPTTLL